jgi:hypothetical protein
LGAHDAGVLLGSQDAIKPEKGERTANARADLKRFVPETLSIGKTGSQKAWSDHLDRSKRWSAAISIIRTRQEYLSSDVKGERFESHWSRGVTSLLKVYKVKKAY